MNELRNPESEKDEASPTRLSRREFLAKSGKLFLALTTGAKILQTTKEAEAAEAAIKKSGESFDFEKYRAEEEIPLTEISKNIQSLEGDLPTLENVKTNKVYFSPDGDFAAVPIGKNQTFGIDRISLFSAKYIPRDEIRSDSTISRDSLIKIGNACGDVRTINWKVGSKNKGKYEKIGLSRIIGTNESGEIFEYNLLQTSGPNYLGNQTEYFYVIGWKEKQDGQLPRLEICKIIEIVHWWEWGKTVYKYYPVSSSPDLRSFVHKMVGFVKAKIEKPSGGQGVYAEAGR